MILIIKVNSFLTNISSFSFNEDDEELERLIALFPEGDLNVREYIHIKDEKAKGGLINDKIVDAILNINKKEEFITNKMNLCQYWKKLVQ